MHSAPKSAARSSAGRATASDAGSGQAVDRHLEVDAHRLLPLPLAQHRRLGLRGESGQPLARIGSALGQFHPVLDAADGARERLAAARQFRAGEQREALGQFSAHAPGHFLRLLRSEDFQIQILGAALRPHRTGRPEADLGLGMETLRVRDRQLRAPESAQERGHRLQVAERDRHAFLGVSQPQQRALLGQRLRLAGRLPPIILRVVDDGVDHLVVAGAAGGADLLAVRAVGDGRLAERADARLPEIRLGHFAVDVVEGQRLLLALLAVGEEFQADAVLGFASRERVAPDLEAEVLGPAVEPLAVSISVQDRGRESPVAERQRALERTLPRVVRLEVQVLEAAPQPAQLVPEQALPALRLRVGDHRVPLEGCERLRAEGGDADVDLRPRILPAPAAQRLRRELDDGAHVLVALGGQADHEVELHQVPAGFEDGVDGVEEILFGVALVDHPPHPFGGGLRRDGEAALAHALDLRGQVGAHRLGAQGRQRDADVLGAELVEEVLQHAVDAGVVAGREAEEAHLFIAGLF